MELLLRIAQNDPGSYLIKNPEPTNPGQGESHHRAGDPAFAPANRFHRRPKITVDAPGAMGSMVQELPVYASQTIVMEKMNHRHSKIESRRVNARGKRRKDIVDF